MAKMEDEILEAIGGEENISYVTHCMTRLRFNLKDESLVDELKVKNIKGILGCQFSGGQFQVIIGPNVSKVYNKLIENRTFESDTTLENINKKEHGKKEKNSFKGTINKILDAITGCLTPILPVLIVSGLIKMLPTLLGPTMLNLVSDSSDFFKLLTFVGDTGFYFFPVFVGIAASKKFGCNTMIAVFIGTVLVHPTFVEIVKVGEPFKLLGLSVPLVSYSSTVFPMIIIVWVMSYVEKYLKKITPEALSSLLVPFLTVVIMLPLGLYVLGPIGSMLGEYLSQGLIALRSVLGPLGVAIIGSLFVLIVATGMHLPLFATAILAITNVGYDDTILVGAIVGVYVNFAIVLGFIIKSKTAEQKGFGFTCLISQFFGGVAEPIIFGIFFQHRRTLVYRMIGSFVGSLYAGLMNCKVYFLASSNFLYPLAYNGGGNNSSFINGIIACVIGFVVAFVLIMMFGIEGKSSQIQEKN
ncbi:PTS transporter subunit EIIC [Enterococcus gallinarum]|uniref:PTS transporter subunit EIIC n=1 Tax=Enterococcus gallinarum TaxID=1353 RepID=UPI0022E57312|nr:PTS transporter subunit EIIC [Enterococcus gallinarum]